MADEKNLAQAKATFQALCDAMDAMDWKYTKTGDFTIQSGVRGDDLPMDLHIRLNEKLALVTLLSPLSITVPEDKRLDMAIAVTAANYGMVHGSFDYNIQDGKLFFRMTTAYKDMKLDAEVFQYLLLCACKTVDNYNDKFLMLSKSMLTLKDFLKSECN